MLCFTDGDGELAEDLLFWTHSTQLKNCDNATALKVEQDNAARLDSAIQTVMLDQEESHQR